MKKVFFLTLLCVMMSLSVSSQTAYDYSRMQREKLGRGVVAMRSDESHVLISWRYLESDPEDVCFEVLRDGKKIALRSARESTTYIDENPVTSTTTYSVRPVGGKIKGEWTVEAGAPVGYLSIPLDQPENEMGYDGNPVTYNANDATMADLDGDGEMELILKWDPSNSRDNSQSGVTNQTYIDAYKLGGKPSRDGTRRMWRIAMGNNIRSGAHYTQMMAADFDGDGKAELVLKTGDGTRDGVGNVIGDANADYRVGMGEKGDSHYNANRYPSERFRKDQKGRRGGFIKGAPEFLTVFEGTTGKALCTVDYVPQQGDLQAWGDNYANRSERYLACVAYLDGVRPSAVMCRGYYTRTVLAAWDWDGKQLKQRWVFDSATPEWKGWGGQGNHNLRVADIDGDGRDEITYGSMCVDDDGRGLYNTHLGHGDAIHLSPMLPLSEHLYVWDVHEDQYWSEFRDAQTGEVLWKLPHNDDVGRGLAADIDPENPGWEMWASNTKGIRDYHGNLIDSVTRVSINFSIWWDGDLCRELLDHEAVTKYHRPSSAVQAGVGEEDPEAKLELTINPNSNVRPETLLKMEGCMFNNGTKSNPSLCCDVIGDWREEVVTRTADNKFLRVYISPLPTPYRFHCFLHDPVYRASVAAQNVAYNQPTGVGFFIGAELQGSGRKFRGWQF
jgi:rhamnogalacturonan endolyase